MAASAADLPLELLQHTIETHIFNHLPSLKSCSLVSWSWRIATLPTLFSKISVTCTHGGLGRQFSSALVQDLPPFLSKSLRYFLIDCFSTYGGEEGLDNVIVDLLPRFPHLRRLSILNSVDRGGEHEVVRALAKGRETFSNITYFTLHRPGWPFYLETLVAFTQLRVLHLIGIDIQYKRPETGDEYPLEMGASAPRLQELGLQLGSEHFGNLVQWFLEGKKIDLTEMKVLKISMSDRNDEVRCLVHQLFPICGKHLETLDAEFYYLQLNEGGYLFENGISHGLPSLTTLRLNVQLKNHADDHQAHLKWLPNFLGRFSCNSQLQVIEIFSTELDILLTTGRHPNVLLQLDQLWSALDQILPPGVTRFAVYRFNDADGPAVSSKDKKWYVKELKRLLPRHASKGVLRHYPDGKGSWSGFDSDSVLRWGR